MDEVPGLQRALLALDDQEALAGEDEEVLLVRLAVVSAAGLAGLKDGDRVAELRELHVAAFEDAGRAEGLVGDPGGVADVDDEPALGDGRQSVVQLFEARLLAHVRDYIIGSTCRRSSCRGRCSWLARSAVPASSGSSRPASGGPTSACRSAASCGRNGSWSSVIRGGRGVTWRRVRQPR